jgi:hypothetical protein
MGSADSNPVQSSLKLFLSSIPNTPYFIQKSLAGIALVSTAHDLKIHVAI